MNFIIEQLISRDDISSGIYNIADDEPLSTNQIIDLIANTQNHKSRILKLPKSLIFILVKIGDFVRLPFNTENLTKLTCSKLKRSRSQKLKFIRADRLYY